MKKYIWMHLALVSTLMVVSTPVTSPALGATSTFIVGTLKTIEEDPVQGNLIRFVETVVNSSGLRQFGDSTNAYTDKNGRFILQVPKGLYTVYVGKGKPASRCLSTSFQYEVSEDRQTLDIASPRFKTYSIQFNDGDPKNFIANVRPYLRQVEFVPVDNVGLGQLSFYCDSQFFYEEPKFVWQTFQISDTQTAPDRARFSYLSGLGQRIDASLPEGWWMTNEVEVELPSVPTVKIRRASLKIVQGMLTGTAVFKEVPEFGEFALDRKVQVRYRETKNGKVSPWRSYSPKFKVLDSGLVKFKVPAGRPGITKLEFVLKGSDFAVASNIVKKKITKQS